MSQLTELALLRARTNELEEAQKYEMKLQERIFAGLVVKFAEYQHVDGPAALEYRDKLIHSAHAWADCAVRSMKK